MVFWENGISQLGVNTPKLNRAMIMSFVKAWLEIKYSSLGEMEIEMYFYLTYIHFSG